MLAGLSRISLSCLRLITYWPLLMKVCQQSVTKIKYYFSSFPFVQFQDKNICADCGGVHFRDLLPVNKKFPWNLESTFCVVIKNSSLWPTNGIYNKMTLDTNLCFFHKLFSFLHFDCALVFGCCRELRRSFRRLPIPRIDSIRWLEISYY